MILICHAERSTKCLSRSILAERLDKRWLFSFAALQRSLDKLGMTKQVLRTNYLTTPNS